MNVGAVAYLEETYDEYMDELQMSHMHPEFITARWEYVRRMASKDVVDPQIVESWADGDMGAVEEADWSRFSVSDEGLGGRAGNAAGKRVSIRVAAGNSQE